MSKEKQKSRVIHVDKLIIHADSVEIIGKKERKDPWLFHLSDRQDVNEEVERDTIQNEGDDGSDNNKKRRPFSWI